MPSLISVHAAGLYGPWGGLAEREGLLDRISDIEPRSPKNSARLADTLWPTLQSSMPCGAMRRSSFLRPPCRPWLPPARAAIRHLKASNGERTEHQHIAAVTKHALRATGLPILENAPHIVPVMIGDADRCKAASDLLLNHLHPTDQQFDRPDRNRASAHHSDSFADGVLLFLSRELNGSSFVSG